MIDAHARVQSKVQDLGPLEHELTLGSHLSVSRHRPGSRSWGSGEWLLTKAAASALVGPVAPSKAFPMPACELELWLSG